jgi:hypothetical protein
LVFLYLILVLQWQEPVLGIWKARYLLNKLDEPADLGSSSLDSASDFGGHLMRLKQHRGFSFGQAWMRGKEMNLCSCFCIGRVATCWLTARCFGDAISIQAEHMTLSFGVVIFGRKGGPSSTSNAEASSESSCRCSTLQRPQVVRPRWCCGGWRLRFIVRAGPSSALPSDLDGDAWRSPAICGGGAKGLDCFLIFLPKVLFVTLEALSSNSWFLVRVMLKGLSCKLYLPRLI